MGGTDYLPFSGLKNFTLCDRGVKDIVHSAPLPGRDNRKKHKLYNNIL